MFYIVYFSIESHGFDGSAPLKPPVGCHGESCSKGFRVWFGRAFGRWSEAQGQWAATGLG